MKILIGLVLIAGVVFGQDQAALRKRGSCKIRFCGPFGNRSPTLTARKVNRINTSLQSRDR